MSVTLAQVRCWGTSDRVSVGNGVWAGGKRGASVGFGSCSYMLASVLFEMLLLHTRVSVCFGQVYRRQMNL